MSGHSKWNNIKHKKEKSDAAKAKIFTKIGKEMAVAIKAGGPDPAVNGKLRDLIAKAKANNVPNDNIQRTIKKFSDNSDITYEEITYEGYGPSGVAIIVETSTDNRNRTAGNVRAWFNKYGGNMGQQGSVMFMFTRQGVVLVVAKCRSRDVAGECQCRSPGGRRCFCRQGLSGGSQFLYQISAGRRSETGPDRGTGSL